MSPSKCRPYSSAQISKCVPIRLFHSPNLVVIGPSMGYEIDLPIGWHHLFVIGWPKYRLGLRYVPLHYMLIRPGEFPSFSKHQWQSLCTALMTGKCLSSVLCMGTVKKSSARIYTSKTRRQITTWSWWLCPIYTDIHHLTFGTEFDPEPTFRNDLNILPLKLNGYSDSDYCWMRTVCICIMLNAIMMCLVCTAYNSTYKCIYGQWYWRATFSQQQEVVSVGIHATE